MDCTVLCFSLVTALVPRCWGFTVDETTATAFQMQSQSFGSSVAQTRNGVIAGAPLERGKVNETGKLYQCFYKTGSCVEISIQVPADAVNMSLGLTLVARDSKVLACGPTVHRACGNNMYVNGYCFLLDENLQVLQQFPEILPECSYHPTDIAFLIDGSGSIDKLDFERMKMFVSEVIKRLSGRNTRFALAQFSNKFEEHFDFNTADPAGSVMWISQIRGLTHTANAIQRVVREIFVPGKGARNGATKILLVITDGRKTDRLPYHTVVQEAERAGIIRYAIGVGGAFWDSRARKELDDIASEPDNEHVIAVHNFDALKGIQDQLRDKIFAIEGTQSQTTSSFQMEMAQEGFSASLTLDGSVLGAVGAYDWSGGLFLYRKNNRDPHFINESSTAKDMNSAYFGYSSQQVQFDGRSGIIVGAPRYEYVGKVVLLETDVQSAEWQTKMEAVGEQVGSYFGAALCSVDLDGDMNTDLVLVGAPLYYDAVSGGRVYVCHIKEKALLCGTRLKGQVGHVLGRFGASMAEIGDITGDGWTDVAVGAPMENENVGALYIFRGKRTSIVPQYIQRIVGQKFSGGFLYFGQAVSGGMDLTGDGLKDIAVGQQGQVLLLRSRPVLRLAVSVNFNPTLIPISAFQCQGQERLEKVASEVQVCFTVAKATQDKLGTILSDLQYSLTLDSERSKIRASFSSNSALLTSSLEIGLEQKCENHLIFLPVCTEDTLTPISLRVNYSLVGRPIVRAKNLRPILSQDSQKVYMAQLPFEKNCGADMKCEDNLRTRFNFSGLDTLVVGLNPELNITAFIQNDGEDSYSTVLQFFFPAGLSYRKVTLLQSSRKVVSVKCHSSPASEEDANRNATCNVNHPIFWSGAEAVFIATFDVSPDIALGNTLQIVTRANSENGGTVTKDMVHQGVLPIKYAVYIIATALEESTKYINFTAGQEKANATVEHQYEVKNLHHRSIPISVMFQVPVKLKGVQLWNVVQVVPSKPQLATCILEEERMGTKDFPGAEQQPSVDCSVSTCKMIRCDILSLKISQPVVFQIKGNVSFQWASQIQQKKVTLVSSAQISYNEQKYIQRGGFAQAQVQTVVERLEIYNYLPVIIGSSVGGLFLLALIAAGLYKIGFFKRQYKELLNVGGSGEEAQEAEASQDTDVTDPPRTTIS